MSGSKGLTKGFLEAGFFMLMSCDIFSGNKGR